MLAAGVLARRTALEDGFLRANLGGCAAYAALVRYRWVPGFGDGFRFNKLEFN